MQFATACGATLARAHARSGHPMAIDAYTGKGEVFTDAMASGARRYADPNERDYAGPRTAIDRVDVASAPEG